MKTSNLKSYPPWSLIVVYVVILFIIGICSHQATGQTSVSFILQPVDLGVGIRADFYPLRAQGTERRAPGFYFSASYGNRGLYREQGLKDHVKATAGVLIPLKPYLNSLQSISIGVNYHWLNPYSTRDIWMNQIIYRHLSFELGNTIRIGRVFVCYSLDIPRWEPCFGAGVAF
jgi:hypothetical protein